MLLITIFFFSLFDLPIVISFFVPVFSPPLSSPLVSSPLRQALERLDGCSNGKLTLDFAGVVARSWSSEQAANTSTGAVAVPPSP